MSNAPLQPTGESATKGRGCLVLFGLIFFAAGLAIFASLSLVPLWNWLGARHWVPVAATVTSSRIVSNRGSESTTHKAEIGYSYSYNGQNFLGERFSHAADNASSNYSASARRARLYAQGTRTTCYVNPSAPTQAVLVNDFDLDMLGGLFGLIFMGVPFLLWFASGTRKRHTPWQPSAASVQSAQPCGGVVLRAQNGGVWGRVVGFWALAGFWNGIIFFMGFNILREGGVMAIFVGLFLIPFALVGLFLLLMALAEVGRLFNPRPLLVFEKPQLRPGETCSVTCELRGGWTRPEKVTVALEGREEATYTIGTSTSTVKQTFYYQPILDTTSAVAAFTLAVPPDAMHSFEAPNNKIIWSVALHAPVRLWPDITEEWKITVEPAS